MSPHLRFLLLLTTAWFGLLQGSSVSADPTDTSKPSAETIIFVIDLSGSIQSLPPNTVQAFLTQAIHVGIVSGEPVKMAVVLFSGKGVKVIGGDDQMPTSALATLHRRVLAEWHEPQGGTPLDEALGAVVSMISGGIGRTTVVNFGDGRPDTQLQPERFESVRKAVDKRIAAIRSLGRPPRIEQQSIDQFLHILNSPHQWDQFDQALVSECQRIRSLQREAQFDLCKRHAAALRGAKVRFISVDFGGGIKELQDIHDAAGGIRSAYLTVEPSGVIPALHNVGLLQLNRIIVPKPLRIDPVSTTFEAHFEPTLSTVAEAGLITVVFEEPIEDFEKHLALQAVAGGVTYSFSLHNLDPNAILTADSIGRVATATLLLPSLPPDGAVAFRLNSPQFSMHPGGMTVFSHLRLRDDLEIVLRPDHLPADHAMPYPLAPNRRFELIAWLGAPHDPKPIPLSDIEPVLKTGSGPPIRVQMEPDHQRTNVFRSSGELILPAGQYDAEVNFLLLSGGQFTLQVPSHIHCQRFDEHITVEIGDSSRSPGHVDGGELGDNVVEHEVLVTLRSRNVDYAIPVELRVVSLMDQEGQSPEAQWVSAAPRPIDVPPGRFVTAKIKFKLPDVIEDSLRNGLFTARLQCIRTDLDSIIGLRPFKNVVSSTDRTVDDITFVLNRPTLAVSAPRGPIDELVTSGQGTPSLTLHNNVGVPLRRAVAIKVKNTSRVPRRIEAVVLGQLRNAQQQYVDGVTLERAEGWENVAEVEPGESAEFRFVLNIEEAQDCQTILRVSAPGFRAIEIPVFVKMHQPFRGKTMQTACYLLGLVCLSLSAVALVLQCKNRRFISGKSITLTPETPTDTLSVHAAGRTAARLLTDVPCREKRANDKRARRMPRQKRLTPADLDDRNPLHVIEDHPDEASMELALSQLDITEDAEPELHAQVIDGGRFQRRADRYGKSVRRHLMSALVLLMLGYCFLQPTILNAAQFAWDVLSRSSLLSPLQWF